MSARSLRVEARSARLTDYLSGTLGGVLAIGQVARAPMDQKLILEHDLVWAYIDRSNNALSAIELHDAADLVAAVQTFDRAVAELMGLARVQEFDRQTWRDQRHALLDDKLAQLKQVGRRHVRGSDRGVDMMTMAISRAPCCSGPCAQAALSGPVRVRRSDRPVAARDLAAVCSSGGPSTPSGMSLQGVATARAIRPRPCGPAVPAQFRELRLRRADLHARCAFPGADDSAVRTTGAGGQRASDRS